jgi:hypothetical protein
MNYDSIMIRSKISIRALPARIVIFFFHKTGSQNVSTIVCPHISMSGVMFPVAHWVGQLVILLIRGSHMPLCLRIDAIDFFCVVGYSPVLHIVLDQALKIARRYDRATS